MNQKKQNPLLRMRQILPVTILMICIITQVVLTYVLWHNYYEINTLAYIGYSILGLSGIFGILPIIEFRIKGKVEKGEVYMKTQKLVKTGIFSIIRHPQYFAGILISLAFAFISQHWVVIILFAPIIPATHMDALSANINLIEKFGDEYEKYMSEVPGLNPLLGIIKLIRRKLKKR
ncbi:MAG: methyltransferase family protein [Candidatus Thorarchaeota archaeon]